MSQSSQNSNNQVEDLYERTLPDVTQILKYAKIDKNNLTNVTQAIYYPKESGDSQNFLLLELNQQLLEDVEKGESLYLKGLIFTILQNNLFYFVRFFRRIT